MLRIGSRQTLLNIGLAGNALVTVVIICTFLGFIQNTLMVCFLMMMASSLVAGPVISMCTSFALDQQKEASSGLKSALFECYMGSIAALFIAISGFFHHQTLRDLYIWIIASAGFAFCLWLRKWQQC
jgi:hypothetical protein